MSHCRVHDGLPYEYEDGCPKCRDDAEQTASDRSEIIRGLEESREDLAYATSLTIDAIKNPGDYSCPHCKFRTLKKGASRCPSCHGEPGLYYWEDVKTKEHDELLRALAAVKESKDEWERMAPARAAAAVAARAKESKEKRAYFLVIFWKVYYAYLLPILVVITMSWKINGKIIIPETWVLFIIPVINWLVILLGMIGNQGPLILDSLFLCAIGGVLGFVTMGMLFAAAHRR